MRVNKWVYDRMKSVLDVFFYSFHSNGGPARARVVLSAALMRGRPCAAYGWDAVVVLRRLIFSILVVTLALNKTVKYLSLTLLSLGVLTFHYLVRPGALSLHRLPRADDSLGSQSRPPQALALKRGPGLDALRRIRARSAKKITDTTGGTGGTTGSGTVAFGSTWAFWRWGTSTSLASLRVEEEGAGATLPERVSNLITRAADKPPRPANVSSTPGQSSQEDDDVSYSKDGPGPGFGPMPVATPAAPRERAVGLHNARARACGVCALTDRERRRPSCTTSTRRWRSGTSPSSTRRSAARTSTPWAAATMSPKKSSAPTLRKRSPAPPPTAAERTLLTRCPAGHAHQLAGRQGHRLLAAEHVPVRVREGRSHPGDPSLTIRVACACSTMKVNMKKRDGIVFVRVGGGFMPEDEFIHKHVRTEARKIGVPPRTQPPSVLTRLAGG